MPRIAPDTKAFARRLRREMTDAERHLWRHLRMRQNHGMKFRRQHPLGNYVLDFACLEAKLVVEVDGGQHAEQQEKDKARTAWLEGQGWQVLRFWNNDVLLKIEGVVSVIHAILAQQKP